MADGDVVEGVCRRCGTPNDLVPIPFTINGQQPKLCQRCYAETLNSTAHTCRGCGRTDLTRLTGLHSTPLEPDGSLQLHERQVRHPDDPQYPEWRTELDVISRVICVDCCPAKTHDDQEWCSVMSPVEVPGG